MAVDEAQHALVGTTLAGRYKIHELVGTGAFGSVFRAEHLALGTRVAVKMLHEEMASDEVRKRFANEARTAAQLRHPNSVSILDFGEEAGFPYIVMEFLDGYTLSDVLETAEQLPLDRIIAIMSQVCAGLEAAHVLGITHRDVKPENIVLVEVPGNKGRREHVKVCDFGIARADAGFAGSKKGGARLTMVGQVVGTPAYMSPEQALGDPVDHRSDVYSVGVVLYLLTTNRLPFEFESPMRVLQAHVDKDPPAPRTLVPSIPDALERLIMRCLAKDPGFRFRTCAALRDALLALLDDHDSRSWSAPLDMHSDVSPTIDRPITAPDDFGEIFDTGSLDRAEARPEEPDSDVGLVTLDHEHEHRDVFDEVGLTTEERLGIDFDNELDLDDSGVGWGSLRATPHGVHAPKRVDHSKLERPRTRRSGNLLADAGPLYDGPPPPISKPRDSPGRSTNFRFHVDVTASRGPATRSGVAAAAPTMPRWIWLAAAAVALAAVLAAVLATL